MIVSIFDYIIIIIRLYYFDYILDKSSSVMCVICRPVVHYKSNDNDGATVVVFCHSEQPMQGKFLFRAQHHNMTNGDYAIFTFWAQKYVYSDMPWLSYVTDKKDIPRLMPVFRVLKQVSIL